MALFTKVTSFDKIARTMKEAPKSLARKWGEEFEKKNYRVGRVDDIYYYILPRHAYLALKLQEPGHLISDINPLTKKPEAIIVVSASIPEWEVKKYTKEAVKEFRGK